MIKGEVVSSCILEALWKSGLRSVKRSSTDQEDVDGKQDETNWKRSSWWERRDGEVANIILVRNQMSLFVKTIRIKSLIYWGHIDIYDIYTKCSIYAGWLWMMYFVAYGMFDVSLTQILPFFDFP